MKLYVISSARYFKGEAALINHLFAEGMAVFHLRKACGNRQEYAALISAVNEQYHHRIALHGFHDLLADFPAIERLHYPEWMRNKKLQSVENEKFTTSTSMHNLNDLEQLRGFSYIFYGPVFDSFSKPGYKSSFTRDFKVPAQKNTTPLIALGGINAGRISTVKQMGFEGAAVLGNLWNDTGQTLDNFNKLMTACSSQDHMQ